MRRRSIVPAVCLLGLMLLPANRLSKAAPVAGGHAHFELRPAAITAVPGQPVTVEVWVDGGGDSVVGAQSYLDFNATILRVADANCAASNQVTPGTQFTAVLQNQVDNGAGTIAYAAGTFGAPETGAFLLFSIRFCGTQTGTSNLMFTTSPPAPPGRNTQIADNQGQSVLCSDPGCLPTGSLTITGAPPSPSTTPVATTPPAPGPPSPPARTPSASPPPSPPPTSPTPCAALFADVPADYWAAGPISWAYCAHLVTGYDDGSFRPDNYTRRAQLAKMLVLAAGWPLVHPASASFSDVPPTHWAYPYIETAKAHNIIAGFNDGAFHPDDYIQRAQLAKMLVLALGWPISSPAAAHFQDVPSTHWAFAFIETAYEHGLVAGYADGNYHGEDFARRAQISKMLYQAYSSPP